MHRALALCALLLLPACRQEPAPEAGSGAPAAAPRPPVSGAAQTPQPAEDGQWPMPAKDYASTRFSFFWLSTARATSPTSMNAEPNIVYRKNFVAAYVRLP